MELKSYYVHSFDRKWYYRMKGGDKGPGLLDFMDDDAKVSSLIVCFVNQQEIRHFTYFDSFIECIQTMLKVQEDKRCFHEVVLEFRNQKMRFDIDIKKTEEITDEMVQLFFDNLIQTTMDVYAEIGYQLIPEKHILVFSSHGNTKWSYHIIIDGFYCENCQESMALFKLIHSRLPNGKAGSSLTNEWLDGSIYNPNHSLRMLLSSKSGRVKKLEKIWKFKGKDVHFEYSEKPRNEKHQMVLEFERSFISLTENCFPIPKLTKKDPNHIPSEKINEEVSDYAYRLFCSVYGNVFKFSGMVSNFILLKRTEASGCPICDRVHEHENAFLVIKKHPEQNGMSRHEIFFNCRRTNGKMISIGEKIEITQTDTPVVIENKGNAKFSLDEMKYVSKTSIRKFL